MKHLVRLGLLSLPIVAVVLLVVQVIVSNELATLSGHMGQLDTQVSEAGDIHAFLETEVASASSLTALRERAGVLGFHEPMPKQIIALSPEVPVAFGVTSHGSTPQLLQ